MRVPTTKITLVLLIAEAVTSAAVALPSELRLMRMLPSSPRRTMVPLARLSIETSTNAYSTARISAPLTVHIFSIALVSSARFISPAA